MKVYRHVNEFRGIGSPVVTIGTFDGVHLGHQQIISRLRESAAAQNGESVVLTFHPHPRLVLFPNQPMQLLNSLDEKIALLAHYGVQHLVVQAFTKAFSQMSHADFVKSILVEGLKVKKLVIGYDHHFGHDRMGGLLELQQLAPKYSFDVEEIPEQDIDAVAVSSTRIRKALQMGEVADANTLLGHHYSISGIVVAGKQLGRTLGFPTANIEVSEPNKLIPPNGIYAVNLILDGDSKFYNGALSIGTRPTFDNGARSIEVNIFDFDKDIYGQQVTLFFKHHLREELKFDSAEDLIEQMKRDKLRSIELLS